MFYIAGWDTEQLAPAVTVYIQSETSFSFVSPLHNSQFLIKTGINNIDERDSGKERENKRQRNRERFD